MTKTTLKIDELLAKLEKRASADELFAQKLAEKESIETPVAEEPVTETTKEEVAKVAEAEVPEVPEVAVPEVPETPEVVSESVEPVAEPVVEIAEPAVEETPAEEEKTAELEKLAMELEMQGRIIARGFYDELQKLAQVEDQPIAEPEKAVEVETTPEPVAETPEEEKIASAQNILTTLYNLNYPEVN